MFTEVTDQDGHHYIIPVEKISDWYKWIESPNYGYEELPIWAISFSGRIVFETYKII